MQTITEVKKRTKAKPVFSFMLSLLMIMLSFPSSVLAATTNVVESEFKVPNDVVGNSTVSKALGIDPEKYLSWLENHEKDNYYLRTPYKGEDHRNPNGDCGKAYGPYDINGVAIMNCTGFVWHVLYKTAMLSGVSDSKAKSQTPNDTNGIWIKFYDGRLNGNIISRRYFATKEEMLKSGYLEKGDIIWMFDNGNEYSVSDIHHIGIYWGNGSSDVMWHSTSYRNSSVNLQGNVISKVVPMSSNPLYCVLKFSDKGNLSITNDSSNHSLTDNNSCYSLYGAVFTATNTSTGKKYTAKATTKVNDGNATVKYKAVLSSIPAGNYKIKETTAPKGYALSTEEKAVTVKSGLTSTTSITFKDTPQNNPVNIMVKKISDTNTPVANAEFTVKFYKGYFTKAQIESGQANSYFKRSWVLKTDKNGIAKLSNEYLVTSNNTFYTANSIVTLPLGTVTIQETKAPSGYKLDNTLNVQKIEPSGSSAVSVSTFNKLESVNEVTSYYELVKTSDDGIVSNIKFNIYKGASVKAENFLKTVVTDNNGKVKEKLDVGTYTFKEITDSRYENQTPKTVTIMGTNTSGSPAKVSFNNTLKNGWLKIIKTAKDGNIKGITFEVYDISKKLVGTYVTNAQGLIDNDIKIKPGTYTVHEVPVAGYVTLSDRKVTIVANQTSSVRFNNIKQGGKLKIKNTSDYLSTDTVTFKIEGVSNNFKDKVQIKVGRSQTIALPYAGRYKVTEVLTDEQLKYWNNSDHTKKELVIENGETKTVEFNNHEKTGQLNIIKTASDNVVSGVRFLLSGTSYSGYSVYSFLETNTNGEYLVTQIPVGEYNIKEVYTPSDSHYSDILYSGTTVIDDCETAVIKTNTTTTVKVTNKT